ncbi:MAG: hypothetical protein GY822_25805 [Deltaproteobacteria bacterium]|nr:hypothetical protein [Deltaproteobacteria bacterium]
MQTIHGKNQKGIYRTSKTATRSSQAFRSLLVLLFLSGIGCTGCLAPDDVEETPEEALTEVTEQCEGRSTCKRNSDCADGAFCEFVDNGEWGCCYQVHCGNDLDCPEDQYCDQVRAFCIPRETCSIDDVTICGDDEYCLHREHESGCEDTDLQANAFSCSLGKERLIALSNVPQELKMAIFDDEGSVLPYPDASFDVDAELGPFEERS